MNAATVVRMAAERGVLIATAESCTGGLIAAALTDVAGSSVAFDRGFVTYSNAAKIEMLGVGAATLAEHGAVSEAVAREMALGTLARSNAGLTVSVTGIAGPGGGSDEKPVGMVCFGFADEGRTETITREFGALGRAEVRRETVAFALAELAARLQAMVDRAP